MLRSKLTAEGRQLIASSHIWEHDENDDQTDVPVFEYDFAMDVPTTTLIALDGPQGGQAYRGDYAPGIRVKGADRSAEEELMGTPGGIAVVFKLEPGAAGSESYFASELYVANDTLHIGILVEVFEGVRTEYIYNLSVPGASVVSLLELPAGTITGGWQVLTATRTAIAGPNTFELAIDGVVVYTSEQDSSAWVYWTPSVGVRAGVIVEANFYDGTLVNSSLYQEVATAHGLVTDPTNVVVRWDEPLDGGSPVTGYVVRTIEGGVLVEREITTTNVMFPADFTGPVQVVAVNDRGESSPKEVVV